MMGTSRRSFLGGLGAAAVAAGVPVSAVAKNSSEAESKRESSSSNLDLVNLLQGTDSTSLFSRGNTLPLVAVPFGMAHWTLQTSSDTPWFFNPRDRRTQGIRCTHQLSPWLSDYGHAIFMPFTGEPDIDPGARASSYRPEDAVMHPYFLKLGLLRSGTTTELAPTERCAILRLSFTQPDGGLVIDLPGKDATVTKKNDTVLAAVHANDGGVAPGFATYYAIRCSVPMTLDEAKAWKQHRIAALRFNSSATTVEVRIATSFISHEQAIQNLERELGSKTFDQIKLEAKAVWEEAMSRAFVEGGTLNQRRVFASTLYRALLFPRVWHEPDIHGQPHHWSPYTGKVTPGVMYADHGYWDVYRAWYPLMSILFPQRLGEILQAWVNAAKEGGWLPQFPCPGYRACMTGSLIDAVFADAAVKGIKGFDLEFAYTMLRKHATQPGDPEKGYGRRGLESYLALGYCAAKEVNQSVAETVDAAYGDFCISQVAEILDKSGDAAMFLKRSENWRNLFDPSTKFLRGKQADGTFLPNFDPIRWGDPYVEGSAWQHRFDVPHNPEGLMQAIGGPAALSAALEEMLTQKPAFHVGSYGREIHEMSEMAAVPFGQYAHSNQPVHHVLYLYATAGRRDRLQCWVRRVLTELYTPDTFAGDEDTGSMSAWFLISSMGFYPGCPGRAEYVLGSPLFDRITLTPEGAAKIVIQARGNGPASPYVQRVMVNGEEHLGAVLSHADLMKSGHIVFNMSDKPAV